MGQEFQRVDRDAHVFFAPAGRTDVVDESGSPKILGPPDDSSGDRDPAVRATESL